MPWTLELRRPLPLPVDAPRWRAEGLRGRSADDWRRETWRTGGEDVPAGDLFDVSGSPAEDSAAESVRLSGGGDLAKIHQLGAGWDAGILHVEGDVGPAAALRIKAGRFVATGNAGDQLAAEARGGIVHVAGNAGDGVGGALPGSVRGMRGGLVVVEGNAGAETSLRQRRGTVCILGDVGPRAGGEMIAGTLIVGGKHGADLGLGMRRGSVVLVGDAPLAPSPIGFRSAVVFQPQFLAFYFRSLAAAVPGLAARRPLSAWGAAEYERFQGDLLHGGLGEVLLRRSAA